MKTATATKVRQNSTSKKARKTSAPSVTVNSFVNRNEPADETVIRIPISELDVSPFNYRIHYSQAALEELAVTIRQSGVLQALIVRPGNEGRYEIVAGERRYRAAIIAGEADVPVHVRNLTDREAMAVQLIENGQRENPHPMEEAHAIHNMQEDGVKIEEIAAILGKNKQYVYTRLKLMALIPEIQEIVAADKMKLVTAMELGQLAADSQRELYDDLLQDWQEQDQVELDDHDLRPYRYDLTRAPFDVKCKKLLPEKGACTNCPFNSATMYSLFPGTEKTQTCSNKQCYQEKSVAGFLWDMDTAFAAHTPAALITRLSLNSMQKDAIREHQVYGDLPMHSYSDITLYEAPPKPGREDFEYEALQEGGDTEFDEETYNEAMMEYEMQKVGFEAAINQVGVYRALLFTRDGLVNAWFSHEKPVTGLTSYTSAPAEPKVTAKEVTEALKEGTATVELLQAEVKRIQDRETRAKEIDREKVHAVIYQRAKEWMETPSDYVDFNRADEEAIRYILLDTLSYSVKNVLDHYTDRKSPEGEDLFAPDKLGDTLRNLPMKQWVLIIRQALLQRSGAGMVSSECAPIVRGCAEAMGIDTVAIEAEQDKLAKIREERVNERITTLEVKISKMNPTV